MKTIGLYGRTTDTRFFITTCARRYSCQARGVPRRTLPPVGRAPSTACGRRWREAPDEGLLSEACNCGRPSPQPSPARAGEGERRDFRSPVPTQTAKTYLNDI